MVVHLRRSVQMAAPVPMLKPRLSNHPLVAHGGVAFSHQAKLSDVIVLTIEHVLVLAYVLIVRRDVVCQRGTLTAIVRNGHRVY